MSTNLDKTMLVGIMTRNPPNGNDMVNFRKIYEFLFSSFRIDRDTELVKKLSDEGVRFVAIVKRAWLYGIFSGLILIPVILIAAVNVSLLGKHFGWNTVGTSLATLLVVNVAYTAISLIRFLFEYRNSRKNSIGAVDVRTLTADLKKDDVLFSALFNQLQTNAFFFIGIVLFYVFHVVVISGFSTGIWAVIDVFFISLQLFLLSKLVTCMINLEMDFMIAAPGKLYVVNQKGMYAEMQTLDADKIKTIKSSYPNFIASFFGHGNVEVLAEGDVSGIGSVLVEYVQEPEEMVRTVNDLLSGRFETAEKIHNAYLKGIISKLGSDPSGPEFRNAIQKFLAEYENQIKTDYEAGEEDTKREIEDIYSEFSKR